MEFYLVKDKRLKFLRGSQDHFWGNRIPRKAENETIAELVPVLKNYATEIMTECLHNIMFKMNHNDNMYVPLNYLPIRAWDFNLEIELPTVLSNNDDNEESTLLLGSMTLVANGENNFLYRICGMFSEYENISDASVKVICNNFGPVGHPETVNWRSEGQDIYFREEDQINGISDEAYNRFHSRCSFLWPHNLGEDLINAWKNGEEFQGRFSILLVLPEYALNTLILPENRYFSTFRKMLDNKIETDMKLVANHGQLVKCHRAMIAASSVKLADLLKNEPGKLVVMMDHLTQSCVKALLDYVYCRDINRAVENSEIAIQVLEAAAEFEMNDLVEVIRKVLLVRQNTWYGVDEAVDLFILAGKLDTVEDDSNVSDDDGVEIEDSDDNESTSTVFQDTDMINERLDWEPIKKRAVEVLKWYGKNKYKNLMASSKYRKLFRDTPQMAMEVGRLFLQLG